MDYIYIFRGKFDLALILIQKVMSVEYTALCPDLKELGTDKYMRASFKLCMHGPLAKWSHLMFHEN